MAMRYGFKILFEIGHRLPSPRAVQKHQVSNIFLNEELKAVVTFKGGGFLKKVNNSKILSGTLKSLKSESHC